MLLMELLIGAGCLYNELITIEFDRNILRAELLHVEGQFEVAPLLVLE